MHNQPEAILPALHTDRRRFVQTAPQAQSEHHGPEVYYYDDLRQATQALLLLDHRHFSPGWCSQQGLDTFYGAPFITDEYGRKILSLIFNIDTARPGIFLLPYVNTATVLLLTGIDLHELKPWGKYDTPIRLSYHTHHRWQPTAEFELLLQDLKEQVAQVHLHATLPYVLHLRQQDSGEVVVTGQQTVPLPLRARWHFADESSAIQGLIRLNPLRYVKGMREAPVGQTAEFSPVVVNIQQHSTVAIIEPRPATDGRQLLVLQTTCSDQTRSQLGLHLLALHGKDHLLGSFDQNHTLSLEPFFRQLHERQDVAPAPLSVLNQPVELSLLSHVNTGMSIHVLQEVKAFFPDMIQGLFHVVSIVPQQMCPQAPAGPDSCHHLECRMEARETGLMARLHYCPSDEVNAILPKAGVYLFLASGLKQSLRTLPVMAGILDKEPPLLLAAQDSDGLCRTTTKGEDFYRSIRALLHHRSVEDQIDQLLQDIAGGPADGYRLELSFSNLRQVPEQPPQVYNRTLHFENFENAFRSLHRTTQTVHFSPNQQAAACHLLMHTARIYQPAMSLPILEQKSGLAPQDGRPVLGRIINVNLCRGRDAVACQIMERISAENPLITHGNNTLASRMRQGARRPPDDPPLPTLKH